VDVGVLWRGRVLVVGLRRDKGGRVVEEMEMRMKMDERSWKELGRGGFEGGERGDGRGRGQRREVGRRREGGRERTYLGVAVVDDIAGGNLRGRHVDDVCGVKRCVKCLECMGLGCKT